MLILGLVFPPAGINCLRTCDAVDSMGQQSELCGGAQSC
uniref:Uncharacterized protein n=1 Tax=Anguilla anguilla TaxID=7936 RepID=A0A0E9VK98_ANGAN